jgi:hypothetical protein
MNDIHVYSILTYEKKNSHDYYCLIVTHEICDAKCRSTTYVISIRETIEGTKAIGQEKARY